MLGRKQTVSPRQVWTKHMRLCHASIASSSLALLITAWLMARAPSLALAARDWHLILAIVLCFSLAARLYLLKNDKGTGRFNLMARQWPSGKEFVQGLQFLATLGRSAAPNGYAHTRAFIPYHAALLATLLGLALSGALLQSQSSTNTLALHSALTTALYWQLFLHVYAVMLLDAKTEQHGVSAMLNGIKWFALDKGTGTGEKLNSNSTRVRMPAVKNADKKPADAQLPN